MGVLALALGFAALSAPASALDLTDLLSPALIAAPGDFPSFSDAPRAPVPPPRPPITEGDLASYIAHGYMPTASRVELAQRERLCLAQAVYFESRGEPEAGQWAVAQVILNRALDGRYPSNICGVVFQGASLGSNCQFSFACDGRSDIGGNGNRITRESWLKANLIALEAYKRYLEGEVVGELPNSTLFFHARRVSPQWASSYRQVASIGEHIFYAGL
jgi:spore germination cell wall hydrolase CwlJ-like protein